MISYLMDDGKSGESAAESTDFRSKQFNLLTAKKKESVHDVMQLGYDVIFSDTDVAIVRDPIPRLLWKDVDYVHSLNAICTIQDTWDFRRSKEEGNTGFYYVRSNNRTTKLWADAFEAAPKFPGLDDQAVFWRIIRQSSNPAILPIGKCREFNRSHESRVVSPPAELELSTCFLDTCAFSSGMLSRVYVPEFTYEELVVNLEKRNETIHTLHANYIKGNHHKMHKMKEHGFWLATPTHNVSAHWAGVCLPYNDTSTSTNATASTSGRKLFGFARSTPGRNNFRGGAAAPPLAPHEPVVVFF